jgi:hypothetical protein
MEFAVGLKKGRPDPALLPPDSGFGTTAYHLIERTVDREGEGAGSNSLLEPRGHVEAIQR